MNGVAVRAWNGLALCAGYGGLELGMRLALGGSYRTVGVVERDLVAAGVLAARMAEGSLEPAPIWDDVTTFNGAGWRGCVDIVTAGFPCQPFSVAGKRKGLDDERWIWPDIARIIGEVGPRYVFLENVPGLIRHGLGHVLGSLAEMGFDAEWGCFSAAEMGAPHKRERVFVLAYRDGERESQPEGADGDQRRRVGHCRSAVASPNGERQQERRTAEPARAQYASAECGSEFVADADGGGRWPTVRVDSASGTLSQAVGGEGDVVSGAAGGHVADADKPGFDIGTEAERGGQSVRSGGLFPPGPGDRTGWQAYLEHSPETEPAVCFPADGDPGWMDELFLLGNGVVPIVAAYAFVVLAQRLGAETEG